MNETKFVKQLMNSFLAEAADVRRELPITWKLRGSASTAGRPDLLVVDAGKTFFIEAKVVTAKSKIDLMEPVTDLQRTNLEGIIAAGGNAFVATMFNMSGDFKRENKYGVVLILHEIISDEMKLPRKINIEMERNKQSYVVFELPKHSFLIMQRKSKWANTEFFRGNCNE